MITEDYVTFETAKLLKEKGFAEKCIAYYPRHLLPVKLTFGGRVNYNAPNKFKQLPPVSAPTLQMAMKWLREVHHYYIQVMLDSWACGGHMGYYVVLQRTDNDFEMMLQDAVDEVFYETYEQACEAAIKYCLENLI